MQRLPANLLCCGALALAACNVDASGVAATTSRSEAIVGSFEVNYSLSRDGAVSGYEISNATELRFESEFVVILKDDGGGLALPVARVLELTWDEK